MLELYKNIKLFRKNLGLTQTELAQRVGYTNKSTIATIEAGKVDLPQSKILEFAKALEVTPRQLMGWNYSDPVVNEIADIIQEHEQEKKIIEAYKAADELTQQMVLRLLKIGD